LESLSASAAIWGVLESGSRNALLILIFVNTLILIVQVKRKLKYGNISWKYITGIVIAWITVSFMITQYSQRVFESSQEVMVKLEHAREFEHIEELDPRFSLFRMAIEYGIQNPSFFGVGVTSFGYAVSEKASGPAASAFQHANEAWNAHNALLTIWIEMGWIGLLFALGFVFT
jgi:O-antigen ligase